MFIKCIILTGTVCLWTSAQAASSVGFTTLDSSFEVDGSPIVVSNMPKIKSQDSIPACAGFSSATVAQFYICKNSKPPIQDCSGLDSSREVSPLNMIAWMHTNKGIGVQEQRNHNNIQLYHEKSSATLALQNAANASLFYADSCFPMDHLVNELGDYNFDKVEGIFNKIEKEYRKYTTEGSLCESCLVKATSELGISASILDLKEALPKKGDDTTFGEYLFKITLDKCHDFVGKRIRPKPTFGMFPSEKSDIKYEKLIDKVKSVLSTGMPLAAGGICIEKIGKNCKTTHSVTISGYRKVCKGSGSAKTCRDVVKVQNSWGKDWQKEYDDGWVDAKELFSNQIANPEVMKNMLAWYS